MKKIQSESMTTAMESSVRSVKFSLWVNVNGVDGVAFREKKLLARLLAGLEERRALPSGVWGKASATKRF
jgi:hypothetical protein